MRSIPKDFLAHMRKDCTIRNLKEGWLKEGWLGLVTLESTAASPVYHWSIVFILRIISYCRKDISWERKKRYRYLVIWARLAIMCF